jgi:dTDP-4-amino-4,6-dideoxygalactose transaminase
MTDKVSSADRITSYCDSKGITLTGTVYKTPVHLQPRFVKSHSSNLYPITDMISTYHICPPLYPELTEKEVDYVSQTLIDFSNGKK